MRPEGPAPTFVKRPHAKGCDGDLYRLIGLVYIDRSGRVDNGGWVAHDYRCNKSYSGCKARVLVTERALRTLAVDALAEQIGGGER